MRIASSAPIPPRATGSATTPPACATATVAAGHEVGVVAHGARRTRRPPRCSARPAAPTRAPRADFDPDVVHVQFGVAAFGTRVPALLALVAALRGRRRASWSRARGHARHGVAARRRPRALPAARPPGRPGSSSTRRRRSTPCAASIRRRRRVPRSSRTTVAALPRRPRDAASCARAPGSATRARSSRSDSSTSTRASTTSSTRWPPAAHAARAGAPRRGGRRPPAPRPVPRVRAARPPAPAPGAPGPCAAPGLEDHVGPFTGYVPAGESRPSSSAPTRRCCPTAASSRAASPASRRPRGRRCSPARRRPGRATAADPRWGFPAGRPRPPGRRARATSWRRRGRAATRARPPRGRRRRGRRRDLDAYADRPTRRPRRGTAVPTPPEHERRHLLAERGRRRRPRPRAAWPADDRRPARDRRRGRRLDRRHRRRRPPRTAPTSSATTTTAGWPRRATRASVATTAPIVAFLDDDCEADPRLGRAPARRLRGRRQRRRRDRSRPAPGDDFTRALPAAPQPARATGAGARAERGAPLPPAPLPQAAVGAARATRRGRDVFSLVGREHVVPARARSRRRPLRRALHLRRRGARALLPDAPAATRRPAGDGAAARASCHHFRPVAGDTLRRSRGYGRGRPASAAGGRRCDPTVFPLPVIVGGLALAGAAPAALRRRRGPRTRCPLPLGMRARGRARAAACALAGRRTCSSCRRRSPTSASSRACGCYRDLEPAGATPGGSARDGLA